MKRLPKIFLFIIIILLTSCAGGDSTNKLDIEGDWIGGFKFGDKWVLICANFKMEDGITKAEIDLPFEDNIETALAKVNCDDLRVQFEVPNGTKTFIFDGECNGVVISGSVKCSQTEGTFHLFRMIKSNNKIAANEVNSTHS